MTMFVLITKIRIFDPWWFRVEAGGRGGAGQDGLVWPSHGVVTSAYLVSIMEMQFADDDS